MSNRLDPDETPSPSCLNKTFTCSSNRVLRSNNGGIDNNNNNGTLVRLGGLNVNGVNNGLHKS